MRSTLQKIILLILLFAAGDANAQLKFNATVSPSQIGKDEFTQLKLMVENATEVQQIVPPSLKNFIIVSGPNQESGMTMINGAVKRYIALNFLLKPKAVGNFTIPPALAKADGIDLKSNPVKVKVTANSSGSTSGPVNSPFSSTDPFAEPAPRSSYKDFILRKGENAVDKINKNMFVRGWVDKNSCYVGEPVVATFKLYTRLKSESNMIKNPSFNGFSVIDLQQPNDMSYRVEEYEGREYNVYTIRRAQLYPLLPGKLDLGIAEIENNVQFIKAAYIDQQRSLYNDLFRDFTDATIPPEGMEFHKVSLYNKPVFVTVNPLPEISKPENFKGAVGSFEIQAKVEKNNFSTDDAGKLAIIISGSGNLQMVNAPEIKWPDGIEGFDSQASDDLFKGTVPVSGRKIFEFPFTMSKPGRYTIPALSFSYFDNAAGVYKATSTQSIEITVTKGTGRPKKIIAETDSKPEKNFLAKFFSNRLRVVSVIAVLIIIGLIIWLKRDVRYEKRNKESIAQPDDDKAEAEKIDELLETRVNPLEKAEEFLYNEDGPAFYMALNDGLKNFLAKKLSIHPEAFNKKNITEQADAAGISNETSVQMQELIDGIEFQLYTPFAEKEKMKEMYDRANDLVQLLNTYRTIQQ